MSAISRSACQRSIRCCGCPARKAMSTRERTIPPTKRTTRTAHFLKVIRNMTPRTAKVLWVDPNGRLLENNPAERRFELTVVSLEKRGFDQVRLVIEAD